VGLGPNERLGPGPNDRVGLANLMAKHERIVEPLEKLADVDLEDLEGRSEGERVEWGAEEYYDDEFESYSSEDEQREQESDKGRDQGSVIEKKNNLAKSAGKIVKTDQARLLFG
jgi:hypothetical protein